MKRLKLKNFTFGKKKNKRMKNKKIVINNLRMKNLMRTNNKNAQFV